MKTIIKKTIGVILIIIGLLALLTPLTPGSWLALVGMELLGIRLLVERALFLRGPRRKRLIQKLKDKKFHRLANYLEKRTRHVNKTKPAKNEELPAKD
ncbi:MAG: hypothetical protein ACYTE8_06210 [Planctomycetota bacterium]|jgi:hypothetical protein